VAHKAPRSQLLTIAGRELWGLLVSPVSYLILFFFYLFRGFEVYGQIALQASAGDAEFFTQSYLASASTQFAVVMVPPILTMRAFAEEKRTGSLELLMTAPVRDFEVVLGKWLASWVFFALLWVPTFFLLFVLESSWFMDTSFSYGLALSGYVGLFALGSLLLSVGLFTSSLTDNQLLASLMSMLFGLGILVIPQEIAQRFAVGNLDVDSDFLRVLLDQSSVIRQLGQWFFRGLVDTGYMVFYVSTTALFLFLTTRVIESRKWR